MVVRNTCGLPCVAKHIGLPIEVRTLFIVDGVGYWLETDRRVCEDCGGLFYWPDADLLPMRGDHEDDETHDVIIEAMTA